MRGYFQVLSQDVHPDRIVGDGSGRGLQEVGPSDEVGHEHAGGAAVDLFGGGHLLDAPGVHHHDPVRHGHGLGLVVGDVDGRDAHALLQAADLQAHAHSQLGVEVGQRLVEQEHFGAHHHGAGERHPLLLAAGELVGSAIGQHGQVHRGQCHVDALTEFVGGQVPQLEAVGDVVAHAQVGEEGVGLEDHGHGAFVGRQGHHVLPVEDDPSGGGVLEARDHAQRRGLAAAGGAEEGDELARCYVEADAVDGGDVLAPVGEDLRDFAQLEVAGGRGVVDGAHGWVLVVLRSPGGKWDGPMV